MYKSIDRIEKLVNSPAFVITIVRGVEKEINRNVNELEENKIVSYIRDMSYTFFTGVPVHQISKILTETIVEELHLDNCRDNRVDIHEMMKQNIGETLSLEPTKRDMEKIQEESVKVNIGSIFGLDDMATVVKKINEPISSVNTAYFLLDSRYRILGTDGTKTIKWGHINSLVRAQGTYNSVGNIRDIISVKLMKFRLPNVSSVITAYGRISTLIHELCPQSFVAHEERRFHFMGDTTIKGNWVEVDPDDFCDGEYKFNKPITHLDSITLSFGSPLEPITLQRDRLLGTFVYANPTVINFPEPHNLLTGDIVYATTFTTKNVNSDDVVISQINNDSGQIATVMSPTSISIPVDSTSISFVMTGTVDAPITILAGTVDVVNNSKIITGAGTNFTADFSAGDYIMIDANVFTVVQINSNTELLIGKKYPYVNGTYTYQKTSDVIVGTGTLFQSEINVNDYIQIFDGGDDPTYKVKSIQDDLLTLASPYSGANGVGFSIERNNSVSQTYSIFFGSKRIFVPIEITYLSAP